MQLSVAIVTDHLQGINYHIDGALLVDTSVSLDFMNVNQRVAGSSPARGAEKLVITSLLQSFKPENKLAGAL